MFRTNGVRQIIFLYLKTEGLLKFGTNNVLMSNFVDIDFVIKLNDKKSRRFDLSEAIFKCE